MSPNKIEVILTRLDMAILDCGDQCKRFLLAEDDFKVFKDFYKSLHKPTVDINQNLDNIEYRGRAVCAISKDMQKDVPVDKF